MNKNIDFDYQKRLFEDFIRMRHQIQSLASFIQNPFEDLLRDGYTTKDEIKNNLEDFNKQYDNFIQKMENLKNEIINVLEFYSK
jgi:cell fate (sporulation/competence/biofilm development) regulator YlbF (YheA/YmcA/DUF963 family)